MVVGVVGVNEPVAVPPIGAHMPPEGEEELTSTADAAPLFRHDWGVATV